MSEAQALPAINLSSGRSNHKDNFDLLAQAIIIQAVKDYQMVYMRICAETKLISRLKLYAKKAEIESFFHSPWYEMLSSMDGALLINRTREIARRKMKKAIHKKNMRLLNA